MSAQPIFSLARTSFAAKIASKIGQKIGTTLLLLCFPLGLNIAPANAQITAQTKAQTSSQPRKICPAQLDSEIQKIIDRPQFRRARWGILIQGLGGSQQTLYAKDATQYFIPASNAKLLTTAAVLGQFGSQFRIRTSVYQMSAPANKITLQVLGRGDPSLTDAGLQALVRQISDRHITQIDRLIGNDQYFQGDTVNPSWEWEDVQAGYGAPVNSLILNQNQIALTLFPQRLGQPLRLEWNDPNEAGQWQIDNRSKTVPTDAPEFVEVGRDLSQPTLHVQGQLRVGSASEPVAISIPAPSQHFIRRFQQLLASKQIRVGETQIVSSPVQPDPIQQGQEIAFVESPPLATLLMETNQESNNLYAEALLRTLGATQSIDTNSSLKAGLAVLKIALTRLGVDPSSYALVDGSGLSRRNLVSPEAIVQTLQGMARSPYAETYRASLAVAGSNGTLQNRFQDTSVQGRFQGKTGALSGVAALSGYLDAPDYAPLAISLLLNQSDLPLSQIQEGLDAVVKLLTQLHAC